MQCLQRFYLYLLRTLLAKSNNVYTFKKKIRRFYGKIPSNRLPVHFPLFLRASACRTYLEIKIWQRYVNRQGYMTKSNTCLFAIVMCLIPENVYGRPSKITGNGCQIFTVKSTDKSTDIICSVRTKINIGIFHNFRHKPLNDVHSCARTTCDSEYALSARALKYTLTLPYN